MSHHRRHHHKKRRVLVVKKTRKYQLVDRMTYICAIIEPLLSIPQVYAIWSQRNAAGVSVSSWIGYWLFGFVWLWYGTVHRDKAIIIYELLYIVVEAAIVLGALLYGGHW